MTERVDLEAIEAALAATTAGRWRVTEPRNPSTGLTVATFGRTHRSDESPWPLAEIRAEGDEHVGATTDGQAERDAAFAVAAHNGYVPELVAEVQRLRHQLRQTTERERVWVGMAFAMAEQSMPAVPVAPVVTEDKDAHRWNVLAEVNAERVRQDAKWGEQNHPDVDPDMAEYTPAIVANFYGIPTAERAKELCDTAAKEEGCTWAHILVEEVAEAVDAACQVRQGVDIDALRNEILQVAAVAVSWVEAIDRRGVAK